MVVDAKHILERLNNEENPEGVVNEAAEQIAFADCIILNKIDLVKEETAIDEIKATIKDINPTAPILCTEYSKVKDCHVPLLNVGGFDLKLALEMDANFLETCRRHRKDQQITSIAHKVLGQVLMFSSKNTFTILLEAWQRQRQRLTTTQVQIMTTSMTTRTWVCLQGHHCHERIRQEVHFSRRWHGLCRLLCRCLRRRRNA